MGFAQYIADLEAAGFDFDAAPTILGNKAEEVAGGAEPAFGPVHFSISFVDPDGPGAPLPDLMDVVSYHPDDYAPVTYRFNSTTIGTWDDDGTQAVLRVKQVTATNTNADAEIVTINPDQ